MLSHNREKANIECIFSVDVEDWFHILSLPSTPDLTRWDNLPSHVVKNFTKLLDIFSEHNVNVTCFFLGWVARKFPHLVKDANRRGHEVASHGFMHELLGCRTRSEFIDDARKSKHILEDLIGAPVLGYRCSGFSVTKKTPWFFDALIEVGYRYDSSVFPALRGHGGLRNGYYAPYWVCKEGGRLAEFPVTVTDVLGARLCFFGGGYLRLFPFFVLRRAARSVLAEGRPVIFYVHPREIHPEQPRLEMNFYRRFKSYVNLDTTEAKVRRVLREFEITTFVRFLESNARGWATVDPMLGTVVQGLEAEQVQS